MAEPLLYTGCGLDHVYLLNGYQRHETKEGPGISIDNIDALHSAIGLALVNHKKRLSGKEIRFLRRNMDLTQAALADLMGCDVQTIARYEKEETPLSGPADLAIRLLYIDHVEGSVRVSEAIKTLEASESPKEIRMQQKAQGWQAAA